MAESSNTVNTLSTDQTMAESSNTVNTLNTDQTMAESSTVDTVNTDQTMGESSTVDTVSTDQTRTESSSSVNPSGALASQSHNLNTQVSPQTNQSPSDYIDDLPTEYNPMDDLGDD